MESKHDAVIRTLESLPCIPTSGPGRYEDSEDTDDWSETAQEDRFHGNNPTSSDTLDYAAVCGRLEQCAEENCRCSTPLLFVNDTTLKFERFASLEDVSAYMNEPPRESNKEKKRSKLLAKLLEVPLPLLNHDVTLGEYLRHIYEADKFMDVRIVLPGRQFMAHRIALCCYSNYFAKHFQTSSETEIPFEVILNGVSAEAFASFLEFVYTGELSVYPGIAADVLLIADILDVPALQDEREAMLQMLTLEGIVKVVVREGQRSSKWLIEDILGNFDRASKVPVFLDIDHYTLCLLLESDELHVQSETEAFLTAVRWIVHNTETGVKHAPEILRRIRFCYMTYEGLLNCVENLTSLTHDDVFRSLILQACWKITLRLLGHADPFGLDFPPPRTSYRHLFLDPRDVTDIKTKIAIPKMYNDVTGVTANTGKQKMYNDVTGVTTNNDIHKMYNDVTRVTSNSDIKKMHNDVTGETANNDIHKMYNDVTGVSSNNDIKKMYNDVTRVTSNSDIKKMHNDVTGETANNDIHKMYNDVTGVTSNNDIKKMHNDITGVAANNVIHKMYDDVTGVIANNDIQKMYNDATGPELNKQIVDDKKIANVPINVETKDAQFHSQMPSRVIKPDVITDRCAKPVLLSPKMRTMASPVPVKVDIFLVGGVDMQETTVQDAPSQEPSAAWRRCCSLPEPRRHHAVAVLLGHIYLTGGHNPETDCGELPLPSDYVYRMDLTTNKWEMVRSMNEARMSHCACAVNGRIYVVGGIGDFNKILDSLECYHPRTNQWTTVGGMPTPRYGAAAAVIGGTIYVAGGVKEWREPEWEEDELHVLNVVESFDTLNKRWDIEVPLPVPRCHAGLVSVAGSLFIVGGATNGSDVTLRSIAAIDELANDADKWTHVGYLTTPRHSAGITTAGRRIYSVGGLSSSPEAEVVLKSVECFDTSSATWISDVQHLPFPANGFSCVSVPTHAH